jgi:hypothetical protein
MLAPEHGLEGLMTEANVRIALAATVMVASTLLGRAQTVASEEAKPDVWEPVRFLVGNWNGTAEGQAGAGTVRRRYAFVLNDRYLHETNVSTYPPQAANKVGEVHEHWSFVSYDRGRRALVLRQFHQEGFVNQYVVSTSESRPGKLVFTSENFENFDNSWRARETYEIRSHDEFVETFELGAPGKGLEVYSRNTFKRAKRTP